MCLPLLSYALIPGIAKLTITNVSTPGAVPVPVTVPFIHESSVPSNNYRVDLTIHYRKPQSSIFHITPDDCISAVIVNGLQAAFTADVLAQQCNYKKGFNIDLGPYLHPGENQVILQLEDFGGSYGVIIYPAMKFTWQMSVLVLAMLLVTTAPFYIAFKKKGADIWIYVAWVIGALSSLKALLFFGDLRYSHDVSGHLEYIHYILINWWRPPAHGGWVYYHPPTYYFIGALVEKIALTLGQSPRSALRGFSYLCYLTFLFYGCLTIVKTLPRGIVRNAVLVLFALWPLGPLYATTINNDALIYPIYAAGFYYFVEWYATLRPGQLAMAVVMAALAIAVKSNGILLYGVIGATVLLALLVRYVTWRDFITRKILLAVVISGLGVMVNMWGRTDDLPWKHSGRPYIAGNVGGLSRGLAVENNLQNYVRLNFENYVQTPFLSTYNDNSGRQYWLNALLKSSLFGEWSFNSPVVCGLLGFFLLITIIVTLLPWLFMTRRDYVISAPLLIGTLVPVSGSMIIRILYPFATGCDFRYIFPMLTAFLPLFGQSLLFYRQRDFFGLYGIGLGLVGAMMLLNAIFIIWAI